MIGKCAVKLPRRLQFGSAISAARHVLLQLITSIIRKLVVYIQQNVFLNPLAFHSSTPMMGKSRLPSSFARPDSRGRLSLRVSLLLISYPPVHHAIFGWRETKYSSRFLRLCAKSRRQFAISDRDSASAQRPCA